MMLCEWMAEGAGDVSGRARDWDLHADLGSVLKISLQYKGIFHHVASTKTKSRKHLDSNERHQLSGN